MLFPIALLFLSFISAPSLFIKRISKLQDLYDHVKGYRTVIGVGFFVFGVFKLINMFMNGGFSMIGLSSIIVMIVLGFLLGFQWMAQNVFASSPEAKEKMREVYFKLSPYEGGMAIAAFFLSVYLLVF